MSTAFPTKFYAWLLTVGGTLGLIASAAITEDKLKLLENPNFVPGCSLNPVISCGSVMKTAQASAFGFPNSWLGLVAFAVVITVGVSLLAGANFKPWYWRLFNLGSFLGVIFVHWLFTQSVYSIHALCLWCMLVWAVTIAIFWYTTLHNLVTGMIPTHPRLSRPVQIAHEYKNLALVLWYILIIIPILYHFWYYFKTVL